MSAIGFSMTSPLCSRPASGTIVNVPYTQECNDVAMMLIQHHSAAEYRNRAIDQFRRVVCQCP